MTGKVNFVLFVLWLSGTGSSSLFNRPFDISSSQGRRTRGQFWRWGRWWEIEGGNITGVNRISGERKGVEISEGIWLSPLGQESNTHRIIKRNPVEAPMVSLKLQSLRCWRSDPHRLFIFGGVRILPAASGFDVMSADVGTFVLCTLYLFTHWHFASSRVVSWGPRREPKKIDSLSLRFLPFAVLTPDLILS